MPTNTLMLPLNDANPDARQLVIVVLDISGTMTRHKDELVKAWRDYVTYTKEDELASRRVETGVVTVSSEATVAIPVDEVRNLEGLQFTTGGTTAMGEGLELALEIIALRKRQYLDAELDYQRPWIVVMSDGKPTDTARFNRVIQSIRTVESEKGVTVYPIAIGKTADMGTLAQMSGDRAPIRLEQAQFREFFQWMSNSMKITAQGGDLYDTVLLDQETLELPQGWTQPLP